jgi:putative flippase GtrA
MTGISEPIFGPGGRGQAKGKSWYALFPDFPGFTTARLVEGTLLHVASARPEEIRLRKGGQVSLVSTLYQRFRLLIHEGAKFCVVGGTGSIVTLAGADILTFDVGLNRYASLTIATIVATFVTFVGNRYWTFRHRQGAGTTRESVLFFVLNGVGLLIQYASLGFFWDGLGLHTKFWYNVANFVGLVIGTLFRFWSYRRWVWHVQPAGGPEMPSVAAGGPLPGGHEALQPALVPPESMTSGSGLNGNGAGPHQELNGNGVGPHQSGQGRPDGPRHARSR